MSTVAAQKHIMNCVDNQHQQLQHIKYNRSYHCISLILHICTVSITKAISQKMKILDPNTRWQHRTDSLAEFATLHVLPKVGPQIFASPEGQIPSPHLTQCVTGSHKYTCKTACKSVKWF